MTVVLVIVVAYLMIAHTVSASLAVNSYGYTPERGTKVILDSVFPTPQTDAWKPYRDMTETRKPIQ